MRHAGDSDELSEVASDELRPVVRDDPRLCLRVLLLGAADGEFLVGSSATLQLGLLQSCPSERSCSRGGRCRVYRPKRRNCPLEERMGPEGRRDADGCQNCYTVKTK